METFWLCLGFLGQLVFGCRFFIQWLASERARMSVIPVVFWWLSLAGSLMLLAYAIHIKDPVFIMGQSTGFLIYARNLHFVSSRKKAPPTTG